MFSTYRGDIYHCFFRCFHLICQSLKTQGVTAMRAALIALLLTFASQAGAGVLNVAEGETILAAGEILNKQQLHSSTTEYQIRYKGQIYVCQLVHQFKLAGREGMLSVNCIDSTDRKK